MALNLTYMWNIVAKLAKLQKSIFSRGTPTITILNTMVMVCFFNFFGGVNLISVADTLILLWGP